MFDDYATSINCEEVYREDEYEFFHNLYKLLEMENEDGNRE